MQDRNQSIYYKNNILKTTAQKQRFEIFGFESITFTKLLLNSTNMLEKLCPLNRKKDLKFKVELVTQS